MTVTAFSLAVGLVLFLLGALGVLVRRNVLIVLMCLELMLNGANLSFVALAQAFGDLAGQVFVFFILAIAAAEAAVGLAIVLCVFRNYRTVDVNEAASLHG
ncbi:MAG TPA: NADH-quinone oxidoreductase subunit NuoK [Oligoflexia bacterium]|nr:NADH-quinone oxidoreductase subunit NuoK [Oligoflexia bacterium]